MTDTIFWFVGATVCCAAGIAAAVIAAWQAFEIVSRHVGFAATLHQLMRAEYRRRIAARELGDD